MRRRSLLSMRATCRSLCLSDQPGDLDHPFHPRYPFVPLANRQFAAPRKKARDLLLIPPDCLPAQSGRQHSETRLVRHLLPPCRACPTSELSVPVCCPHCILVPPRPSQRRSAHLPKTRARMNCSKRRSVAKKERASLRDARMGRWIGASTSRRQSRLSRPLRGRR